jgi:hypothetical protein
MYGMQLPGELKRWILSAALGAALFFGLTRPVKASINVSPKTVNFPNQAAGSTSKPVTLTITTHSSRRLEIVRALAPQVSASIS